MSAPAFAALGVPAELVSQLAASGIVDPTPIQQKVIPSALAGRDVIGQAPTGSGKTLAFGLPLVAGLTSARRRSPTALVLAPTRELAQQIAQELRPLCRSHGHDAVALYGGVGYGPQRKALNSGVELVVACPGRLEDLISMGALSLSEVRHVVVDEADRMSDMGFLPAVRRLLDQTHADRQVLLFSATLDGAVTKLAAATQRDPERHEVGTKGPDVTAARHLFWAVDRSDRSDVTAAVVREVGSSMVFCRTRRGADRLAKQLQASGVTAAPIHGGRSQPQRARALKAFAGGAVSALVATDVAARGVHVDDVAAVLHYDPPEDAATYVHRSGRTARAGASGIVVSLVERGNEHTVRTLQRQVGIEGRVQQPSIADLCSQARGAVDDPTATRSRAKSAKDVRSEASEAGRNVGVVKFFHDHRGYGFIERGRGEDLFVHHSNLSTKVSKGQRVEYTVGPGRKGDEAFDVVAV
ncbi:MAG: DEAD/DEAH box helicase [Acidimicrobiia bacterium]|nr:DEAD/DEAH box helicase [Acidimicrobiia bacterium]